MPPGSINTDKESAVTYQPVLLAVLTFADASVLRLATHPLNSSEGGAAPTGVTGFAHNGQDFFGRLSAQDLEAIQSMSDAGVDQVSGASLTVADPDSFLHAYDASSGIKGATMELFFLFVDVGSWTFSTNFDTKFVGVCNSPQFEADRAVVSAISKLNLQKLNLPQVRIQRRCPWVNPVTVAQRAEASDEDSQFYECGETRSLATAPPCNYTRETCTQPNRFGGITFAPPQNWSGRGYLDGKTIDGTNSPNDAKYGEPIPLVYGTTWMEPPLMNVLGDANSTRMEAVLCLGNLDGTGTTNPGRVLKVLVNDVEVPFVAYSPDKNIFRWQWVNPGNRDGGSNLDAGYNGQGDPYGSMAAILIVVYRKLASSENLPRVRVLMGGPKIRVYSDAVTYAKQYSSNPAWVLLDLLTWCNLRYADIDLASFVSVAGKCSPTINYKDSYGNTLTHERFDVSLSLRERRAAAEVIRALLRGIHGNLVWISGKLTLVQRSTLAEQQAAPISGSNYNTAISSYSYAGGVTNGYVAYSFNESSIIERDGKYVARRLGRPLLDMPNRVSFGIQDKHNDYVNDSVTVLDSDDVDRAQQEVSSPVDVLGINSYDQAFRVAKTLLAESLRGTPSASTAGTWIIEFETSVKAAHLRVGQIVRFSLAHRSISNQLFRIMRIAPATNYETVRLTLAWHSDAWYVDSYGQGQSPRQSQNTLDSKARPPFPWQPNFATPMASDSMFNTTEETFSVFQDYSEISADGTPIAIVHVGGYLPANGFSDLRAPVVALQASAAAGSGSLAGGGWQYWVGICAVDSNGDRSVMSLLSTVIISAAGASYSVTVPVYVWPTGTVGYEVYAANDPVRLTFQSSGSGTPSSITVSAALKVANYAPPDSEAGKVVVQVKVIAHSGILGTDVVSVAVNTITCGSGWTVNQFAGYDVSLLAKVDSTEQPVANFRITANDATTLTVTPNPVGIVAAGDVVVIRSKPTVSGSTLTDANWKNVSSNAGLGLSPGAEVGRVLRIISGPGRGYSYQIAANTDTSITIAGDWIETPDSTSRYIVEEAAWLNTSAEVLLRGTPAADVQADIRVELTNYLGQTVLLAGYVVSPDGLKQSLERFVPIRELYVRGLVGDNTPYQLEYLA